MSKKKDKKKQKRESTALRRASQMDQGYESTCIKMPEGLSFLSLKDALKSLKLTVDIVPYVAGEGNPVADSGMTHYERSFFVHKNIGPGNGTYVCPSKTENKACPVCEHRDKLLKDGADHKDDTVKALRAKERELFLVVCEGQEDKGILLWDISTHLFGNLLHSYILDADEDENISFFYEADAEDGKRLRIGFEKKTFNGNDYFEAKTIRFKDRSALSEGIVNHDICLDDLLIVKSYEELKAVFLQTGGETSKKEGSKEPKKDKKKKNKKKKGSE